MEKNESNKETEFQEENHNKTSSSKSSAASYECSICLDIAKEPVVIKCGHLFCWPCIYSWNQQKNTCPNCNNIIGKSDFVPIYNKDQNKNNTDRFKIPERPKGERNENTDYSNANNNNGRFSNLNFGFGFFGFPFFGLQFNLGNNQGGFGSYTNTFNQQNNLMNNINISSNERVNKAAKHLVAIVIFLLVYYLLLID